MNNRKLQVVIILAIVVCVATLVVCSTTLPTTEPSVKKPSATEHSTTETPTTEASATEPSVTEPPTTEETVPKKVYVTMYATRSVNYRLGPSTDFKKSGTLSRGDAVKIVEDSLTENGWLEADIDGEKCYIYGQYLSKTKPSKESNSGTKENTTTKPPATEPPATEPPVTNLPATDPPAIEEKTCSPWCLLGEFTIILEPTTTSPGVQVAYCIKCGEEYTEEVARLVIPEKLENIDPRITITEHVWDGNVSYKYKGLAVVDTRMWGGAPVMVITEDGCLDITYYKQDGTVVEYTLRPSEGYISRLVIFDDGSFQTGLIGDFND